MAMKIPLLVLPVLFVVVVVSCHSLLSGRQGTAPHRRSGVLSRKTVPGKWTVNELQKVHRLSESPLNKRRYVHKHVEVPRLSIPDVHSLTRPISSFGKSDIQSHNPRGTLRQMKIRRQHHKQLVKAKSVKQIAEEARRRYLTNRPEAVVRISQPKKGQLKTDKSRHAEEKNPLLRNWSRAVKKIDRSSLGSVFTRYSYINPYEKWYMRNSLPQMYREWYKYTPYRRKHVVRRSVSRKSVLNTIMSISQGEVSKSYHKYKQGRLQSVFDFLTNSLTQYSGNVAKPKISKITKAASTTETKVKTRQNPVDLGIQLDPPVSVPPRQGINGREAALALTLHDGPVQNHNGYSVNQPTHQDTQMLPGTMQSVNSFEKVLHSPISGELPPQAISSSTATTSLVAVENKAFVGRSEDGLTTEISVREEVQNPTTANPITQNLYVPKSQDSQMQQTTETPVPKVATKQISSNQSSGIGQVTKYEQPDNVNNTGLIKLGKVAIKANVVDDSPLQRQRTRGHSVPEATSRSQIRIATARISPISKTSILSNPSSEINTARERTTQDIPKDQLRSASGTIRSASKAQVLTDGGTNTHLASEPAVERQARVSRTDDPSTQIKSDPGGQGHRDTAQNSNGQLSEMGQYLRILSRLQGTINRIGQARTPESVQHKTTPSPDQASVGSPDRLLRQDITATLNRPRQEVVSRNSRVQQQQQLLQQQQHVQQDQSRRSIHTQQPIQKQQRVHVEPKRHRQRQQQQQPVKVDPRGNVHPQRQQQQQQQQKKQQHQQHQQHRPQQQKYVQVDPRRRNVHPQQQQQQQQQHDQLDPRRRTDPRRRIVHPQQRESVPQKQVPFRNLQIHSYREAQAQAKQNPSRSISPFEITKRRIAHSRNAPKTLPNTASHLPQRSINNRPRYERPPSYPNQRSSEGREHSGPIREHSAQRGYVRTHPRAPSAVSLRNTRS